MQYFQSYLLKPETLIGACDVDEALLVVSSVCSFDKDVMPSVEVADPIEVLRADRILFIKDGNVFELAVCDSSPRKVRYCLFK